MDIIITWSLALFALGGLALIYGGYQIVIGYRQKLFGIFAMLFGAFIIAMFITNLVV